VATRGNVNVDTNSEATGTVECPTGMRVLSGEWTGVPVGPLPVRLTPIASEPDPTGTKWSVTMRAGDVPGNFQVSALCAFVG
jgi:hypothetical protein